jgi:hypothetical protein
MAEEEDEEEAAAATPSLREQGNNHNASFTAGKKPAAIYGQDIKEQILKMPRSTGASFFCALYHLRVEAYLMSCSSCALSCMRRQVFFSLFHFLSIFKAELIS